MKIPAFIETDPDGILVLPGYVLWSKGGASVVHLAALGAYEGILCGMDMDTRGTWNTVEYSRGPRPVCARCRQIAEGK